MEQTVITVEDLIALDDTHTEVVFCMECGGVSRECPHNSGEFLAIEW